MRSAGARQQAQLHFRQTQNRFRIVGANPAVTGQRQLKPAAQTGTVDRGNDRDRQTVDLRHHLLALTRQLFGFQSALRPGDHVDIRAGDKVIRLGRDKDQTTNRFVVADLL